MNQESKIYERMAMVQLDVECVAKDRQSTQGYSYRGIDDVYNHLHDILSKHQVFCVPIKVENVETHEREAVNSVGKATITRFTTMLITYRFYTIDGSYIDIQTAGEAMDSSDKSYGKCMSYAHKYTMLQCFSIPTKETKDTEADCYTLQPQAKPQPQAPKPTGLSDSQVKRAFAIALSKGITADMLKAQCLKVCGSNEIKNLSKQQYDTLCSAIEARPTYQTQKEIVSAQNVIDQAVDTMKGQG